MTAGKSVTMPVNGVSLCAEAKFVPQELNALLLTIERTAVADHLYKAMAMDFVKDVSYFFL